MPVLLAAAGFLLVGLDASVNIAFPAIAAAFRISSTAVRWVVIYYVATYALTAFAAGVLADRLGPGRVVRAGLVLSLFCFAGYALVTSFEMLLLLRVLQGMSGGLIYGAAPALVTLSLPASRHGWGLGVFLYRVPVAAAMIALAARTTSPRAGGPGAWRMVVPSDILRRPVLHAGLLAFLANYAQFAVWLLVP